MRLLLFLISFALFACASTTGNVANTVQNSAMQGKGLAEFPEYTQGSSRMSAYAISWQRCSETEFYSEGHLYMTENVPSIPCPEAATMITVVYTRDIKDFNKYDEGYARLLAEHGFQPNEDAGHIKLIGDTLYIDSSEHNQQIRMYLYSVENLKWDELATKLATYGGSELELVAKHMRELIENEGTESDRAALEKVPDLENVLTTLTKLNFLNDSMLIEDMIQLKAVGKLKYDSKGQQMGFGMLEYSKF
ncbi:MAG: hypothetical protein LBV04_07825 [Deferribacteraceae bacterium]|jgi:hypothetical protein|nr:hypothetical protein [Deferribacteraceae bacterium]